MIDNYETGQILDGKVTGIQPYGAFVALDDDTQGLVHISEITNSYVQNIHDYLTVGDDVKVKVLEIDTERNRISLSMREAQDSTQHQTSGNENAAAPRDNNDSGFNTLKDKLDEWIQQSEERQKTFKD